MRRGIGSLQLCTPFLGGISQDHWDRSTLLTEVSGDVTGTVLQVGGGGVGGGGRQEREAGGRGRKESARKGRERKMIPQESGHVAARCLGGGSAVAEACSYLSKMERVKLWFSKGPGNICQPYS